MGQCCTASERGHKQARKSLQVVHPKFYHSWIYPQSICGFLEQKIVCGWIKAKSIIVFLLIADFVQLKVTKYLVSLYLGD